MSKLKEIVVVSKEEVGGEPCISYQNIAIPEHSVVQGERALSHGFLLDSFRKIMGRTLTIVDASIVDPRQNKALKDLIRAVFNDEIHFSSEMAYDQEELQKLIPDDLGEMEKPVSVEEMLGVE